MPNLLLALVSLALGCANDEPPLVRPSGDGAVGVVLRVSGLPLSAEEIAPMAADVQELYPEYALVHARRLALTNDLLPRLAAHASAPEAWQHAREACEHADLAALVPTQAEGHYRRLGLSVWSAARHLTLGEWSGPRDLPGRWVRMRLDERVPATDVREESLRVSMLAFPYLASDAASMEAAITHARLEVIDPAFGEAIPEDWKYRMRGRTP